MSYEIQDNGLTASVREGRKAKRFKVDTNYPSFSITEPCELTGFFKSRLFNDAQSRIKGLQYHKATGKFLNNSLGMQSTVRETSEVVYNYGRDWVATLAEFHALRLGDIVAYNPDQDAFDIQFLLRRLNIYELIPSSKFDEFAVVINDIKSARDYVKQNPVKPIERPDWVDRASKALNGDRS
jgi:hypothetical protein